MSRSPLEVRWVSGASDTGAAVKTRHGPVKGGIMSAIRALFFGIIFGVLAGNLGSPRADAQLPALSPSALGTETNVARESEGDVCPKEYRYCFRHDQPTDPGKCCTPNCSFCSNGYKEACADAKVCYDSGRLHTWCCSTLQQCGERTNQCIPKPK